jgi:hypothetical protein
MKVASPESFGAGMCERTIRPVGHGMMGFIPKVCHQKQPLGKPIIFAPVCNGAETSSVGAKSL